MTPSFRTTIHHPSRLNPEPGTVYNCEAFANSILASTLDGTFGTVDIQTVVLEVAQRQRPPPPDRCDSDTLCKDAARDRCCCMRTEFLCWLGVISNGELSLPGPRSLKMLCRVQGRLTNPCRVHKRALARFGRFVVSKLREALSHGDLGDLWSHADGSLDQ